METKKTYKSKINPFLWFDSQAEEAAQFYISAFRNATMGHIVRYDEAGAAATGQPQGSVMTAEFKLAGQQFTALNGGPVFKFTDAVSFFVYCESEDEIDTLWKKLTEGGEIKMELQKYPFSEKFGWVQDKFGISWQLSLVGQPQKIVSFLWFGDQAEDAMKFYTEVFSNSEIKNLYRFEAGDGAPEGKVMHALFTMNGQEFMAMDSNPGKFSEAQSLVVNCESQEEVDYYWQKLSDGGEPGQCGWLKDKFGVSWQIVPVVLPELLYHPDPVKSQNVMQAMLQMNKLDIATLLQASRQ